MRFPERSVAVPATVVTLCVALLAFAVPTADGVAGAANAAPKLSDFQVWATAGSRVAFESERVGGRRGLLWVDDFGSNRPRLLRAHAPPHMGEIDQLAAGPNGSWGCLERGVGNTESYYAVDLVTRHGKAEEVATAGGPTGNQGGPPVSSIPFLVGDGSFLGYLYVTPAGKVILYQITASGHHKRIADLVGLSAPGQAAIANGHLAIRELDGSVAIFTTKGQPLATIAAHASQVALTANRVVVVTTGHQLVVYSLQGNLMHTWPLGHHLTALAAYGRYLAYTDDHTVRAIRLSNGIDRVISRAGKGWFFTGLSLQAPGAIAPHTTDHAGTFRVTLRFLPTAKLRSELG
jgi:hypothetical protein